MALASEQGHWYDREGNPCYTIIGANGNERNTTLRDARKYGYAPSVTTILKIIAKPGLERWKIDQALLSALTLPQIEGESLDDFKRRAAYDSTQESIKAAEVGTAIHAAIEQYYYCGEYQEIYHDFIMGVKEAINEAFSDRSWSTEKSFYSPLGYGGKVDLHCDDVVIDIKTKEFGPEDNLKAYDEQIMQLEAYKNGLGIPDAKIANLYVSRTVPGHVQLIIHETGNHFRRFCHLLSYWKLTKNYEVDL